MLIGCRSGTTIVFPVEQLGGTTIVNEKLVDCCGTEAKSRSEHAIVTVDVPATSDVYRV